MGRYLAAVVIGVTLGIAMIVDGRAPVARAHFGDLDWLVKYPTSIRIRDFTYLATFEDPIEDMKDDLDSVDGLQTAQSGGPNQTVIMIQRLSNRQKKAGWVMPYGENNAKCIDKPGEPSNGQCNATENKVIRSYVFINTAFLPSSDVNPSDYEQLRWALTHEVGHVLGLSHVPGCGPATLARQMLFTQTGATACSPFYSSLTFHDIDDLEGLY